MFSGYLQAGLYDGLNGRAGLAGWKWLFIFDAIISIPIAIYGYWAIPDQPTNTRAFYLSQEVRFQRLLLRCSSLIIKGPGIWPRENGEDGTG